MKRIPFVLKFYDNMKTQGIIQILNNLSQFSMLLDHSGIKNFSIWSIQDFLFCYGEYPDEYAVSSNNEKVLQVLLSPYCEIFAAPGTLSLMYHDIGIVREDKRFIRHRVFATKLKDGCAAEYKRRHDELIVARGDKITLGPESNFTIWNANGYIFGYCELVKSYDHKMTENEKKSTIAWETRQLEIMDWLTDDVDWITGDKHDAVQMVYCQAVL